MKTIQIFPLLFFILLINAIASGLFTPLSMQILAIETHLFAVDEQLSRAIIDIMYGAGLVVVLSSAYFLCSPILGLYSDMYGRKKIFKTYLGCAFLAYGIILVGIKMHAITVILLGTLLQGVSMGILPLVQAATADITNTHQRPLYFGMLNIYIVGLVLSAQLGSYLLTSNLKLVDNTTDWMLLTMLLLQVVSFLMVSRLPETLKEPLSNPKPVSYTLILTNLTHTFAQKQARYILCLLLLFQFAWGVYFEDMFIYLTKEIHFSDLNASLFVSYTVTIIAIGILCFYPLLTKKASLQTMIIFNFFICLVGLLGCSLFSSAMGQWIFIIPFALGMAMLNPILWTLLLNMTPSSQYGLVMGITGPLCAAIWIISDILGDFLNEYSLELPINISMILMIICLVFAFYISRYLLEENSLLNAADNGVKNDFA